ncbi:hypothetical protein Cgig2_021716 [Carnegiea gigantea]|uniref:RING-type E3 ubiquitin transferase n=1 Tax=Carnegiea gigantea TaxID=171969 RepID=A0A9Q1GVA1_9CARY|nr:hypothetical protein Cgig2_021716 [Carnegiea gigantea]
MYIDGILLGGILIMYEFHNFLRPILLLMYSFWIPQIITNIIRDSRKPLHPHYILGMTVTRLAIPLYTFGCPNNFMRIQPHKKWCICLSAFMGVQSFILLLQHYLGSRCFIPRQLLPDQGGDSILRPFVNIFVSQSPHTLPQLQELILPEKYSYYRRFNPDANRTTDCVICMTAIDLSQRSNDCMVDGHKDGMPYLSKISATCLMMVFHFVVVEPVQQFCCSNSGLRNINISLSPATDGVTSAIIMLVLAGGNDSCINMPKLTGGEGQ